MCGIYCALSRHGHALTPPDPLLAKLRARGPDGLRQHVVRLSPSACLTFAASVLSLRGDAVVAQPLVDDRTGSVLCWNGEAWSVAGERVAGNDSEAVFRWLLAAEPSRRGVLDAFSAIKGPFGCVFYDGRRQELFFGRDVLGRRSMVKSCSPNGDFILCSVPHPADATWTEVEADGMYVLSPSGGADSVFRCPIKYSQDEPSGDFVVRHLSLQRV
jgi:asparagine synthetase B (glutamine-hydrolysing)